MTAIKFNTRLQDLSKMLRSFAYRLTQDSEAAKDLFQETSMRAFSNRDKYREGTNLKAWLFTIMKNTFINDYRKKSRAIVINDLSDNNYYLNSGSKTIVNKGDSNIMMEELEEIIERLDESIRIPFMMHYQGFKYQEIADKFEMPLGTVKSKIFFARKQLKYEIKKRYNILAA